jgi:uncharacterized membrane protein YgcG
MVIMVAQNVPLHIHDDYNSVDPETIGTAAQPLLERDAKVAVFVVDEGDTHAYLAETNLTIQTIIDPVVIAIFIFPDAARSQIVYGNRWQFDLKDHTQTIEQQIQPSVQNEDYHQAAVTALTAIEARIAGDATTIVTLPDAQETSTTPWFIYFVALMSGIVGIAVVLSILEMAFYA